MRLVGRDGKESTSGRLEVFVNNQWGTVRWSWNPAAGCIPAEMVNGSRRRLSAYCSGIVSAPIRPICAMQVCDSWWGFGRRAATVVCRQLGMPLPARAVGGSYWGAGSGPIVLDWVACVGSEANLDQVRGASAWAVIIPGS